MFWGFFLLHINFKLFRVEAEQSVGLPVHHPAPRHPQKKKKSNNKE